MPKKKHRKDEIELTIEPELTIDPKKTSDNSSPQRTPEEEKEFDSNLDRVIRGIKKQTQQNLSFLSPEDAPNKDGGRSR